MVPMGSAHEAGRRLEQFGTEIVVKRQGLVGCLLWLRWNGFG